MTQSKCALSCKSCES